MLQGECQQGPLQLGVRGVEQGGTGSVVPRLELVTVSCEQVTERKEGLGGGQQSQAENTTGQKKQHYGIKIGYKISMNQHGHWSLWSYTLND